MTHVQKRDKVFISYSHKDAKHLKRLQVHLKPLEREDKLDYWDDTRIKPGMRWRQEIQNAIDVSKVAVLLISADFFASDFITECELPFLLEAEKLQGATIITIILSPSRYENDKSLSVFQSTNPVSKPLSKMKFHEREKVWESVANRIEELLIKETKVTSPPPESSPAINVSGTKSLENTPVVFLDALPALGLFINRTEHVNDIKEFLASETTKLVIVRGFIGIGKTQLAAKVINETKKQFAGILWVNCKEDKATPDFVFSRLNIFFEQHNENALTGIWNDARPDMFEFKTSRLLNTLSKNNYLLVFDRFNNWLNADLDIKNRELKDIFTTILKNSHQSKIILISDNRAFSDTTTFEIPFGTVIERTLTGLNTQYSIELLKNAGLNAVNEKSLNDIAMYCDGNPALLQICSYLITSHQYDVDELLLSGKMAEKINNLLKKATKDLDRDAYDALAMLSVMRIALSKKQIELLGFKFSKIISNLLDRFLVLTNVQDGKFTVSTTLRNFITEQLTDVQKREYHSRAVAFFYAYRQHAKPTNFEEAALQLEEAYHYFQTNNAPKAAEVIFAVAPQLIEWGYIDIAEQNIQRVFAATTEDPFKAAGNWFKGSIADLRSNYAQALHFFEDALTIYKSLKDYTAVALTLFRIGRIYNGQSNFSTANKYFNACIETCKINNVSAGWSASILGMAWNFQERSADIEQTDKILQLYKECIEKAQELNDAETLSSAYRQTGFLLWTKMNQKESALMNYEQALFVAQNNLLKKEMAAIYSELGYLYSEWKDFEKAKQNCEDAIKNFQLLGDQYGLSGTYLNLGKVYFDQKDFESALMYYNEGRKIAGDIKNYGAQAWAYYCTGRALLSLGRISESASVFSKAAELGKQYNLKETFEYASTELQQLQQ